MSDDARNPYSELVAEHERRVDELMAGNLPAVQMAELVLEACGVFQQKFADLLANRQASNCPDFESLYKRKAELDRQLHDRP